MQNILVIGGMGILFAVLLILDTIRVCELIIYEDYSCGDHFDQLCCPILPENDAAGGGGGGAGGSGDVLGSSRLTREPAPECFCKCGRLQSTTTTTTTAKTTTAHNTSGDPAPEEGRRLGKFKKKEVVGQLYCGKDNGGWAEMPSTTAETTTSTNKTSVGDTLVRKKKPKF